MIFEVNDNIKIWQEYNPFELSYSPDIEEVATSKVELARWGFNKQRISIINRWFDVLSPIELVLLRNKKDGYYRVIYIQINSDSGEYYIGKANRSRWSELNRYQGSGLKFKNKYKKDNKAFNRYFIAICDNAEETEKLEASIVTEELLKDDKCLNLIAGGAGVNRHQTSEVRNQKLRDYMKSNPHQYRSMMEAAKKAFQSGDSPALRARNKRIKQVMSAEKYREMSKRRIMKWKDENPEDYINARIKNREKIGSQEVQEKRKASLEKWQKENPEKYQEWQDKLIKSRTSPDANKKRSNSIKEFNKKNPDKARANALKRSRAAALKHSKAISMIDLVTGETIKEFESASSAAYWLKSEGYTESKNPASSISAVCNGRRSKAYGFYWRFLDSVIDCNKQLSFKLNIK